MEETNVAANVEELATPQADSVETTNSGTVEQQDLTQTQAFARRLKEEKQKAIDSEYERLYGADYGIKSKADYDSYLERRQLEEQGKDPELYQEVNRLKSQLSSYEQEKKMMQQEKTLSSDPVYGGLFKEWKPKLDAMIEQYGGDYDSAFTFMCRQELPTILAKQQTQQANSDNAQKSMGSAKGIPAEQDIISREDFEANKNDRNWVIKNFNKITKSRAKW